MIKLLVLDTLAEELAEQLEKSTAAAAVTIYATALAADAVERCADAELVLGQPDLIATWLPHATKVRWVQSTWAGVEALVAANGRRDYQLTALKGVFGASMAEYVLAWLLADTQRVAARLADQNNTSWNDTTPTLLQGQNATLIGLGSIGRVVARRLLQFGINVRALTRTGTPDPSLPEVSVSAHRSFQDVALAIEDADILVSLLPATPDTTRLLDRRALAVCKPGCTFINAGRASVVDDHALLDALTDGHVASAILDVTEPEPLPHDHPFWRHPKVQLTFHTAAPSRVSDIVPVFLDNLVRWQKQTALLHAVDFARGY